MNEDPLKAATARAVLRLLEPLAQFLLDAGIGVGEVQALTELAFVSAARTSYQKSGEPDPDNVARIAVSTGLTRAAVTQLLSSSSEQLTRTKPFHNRASLVLQAWCTEAPYQDRAGAPAVLPMRGNAPSFQALVKLSSGDELSRTILKELQRVGAVRRLPNNHVQVVRRTYMHSGGTESLLIELGEAIREHLHVLTQPFQRHGPRSFRRRVCAVRLDAEQAAILERDYSGQFDSLFNSLTNALSHQNTLAKQRVKKTNRLTASVFILREPESSPTRGRPEEVRAGRLSAAAKRPSARKRKRKT